MTFDKILIAGCIVALLAIAGCVKKPETVQANGEFDVATLFTDADGCKVKRFYDSNYRYYAVCKSGVEANMTWTESCGKNCTRTMDVPTAVSGSSSNTNSAFSTTLPNGTSVSCHTKGDEWVCE